MTSPLRVAVFNDSPTMRAAIRAALERVPDMYIVTEQASAEHAAAVVAHSQANAVVMDVVMPGVDSYQATREIMRHNPVVACIGPVTAATARELGLRVDVMAREYTMDGLIDALERWFD